jgi:hypothetical protein
MAFSVVMRFSEALIGGGFGAFRVSRVIELLWALLSGLLSDNNFPVPPLDVPVLGRALPQNLHAVLISPYNRENNYLLRGAK